MNCVGIFGTQISVIVAYSVFLMYSAPRPKKMQILLFCFCPALNMTETFPPQCILLFYVALLLLDVS
jgi:hypothetical protein